MAESKEIATEDTLVLVLDQVTAIHKLLRGVLDEDKDAIKTKADAS